MNPLSFPRTQALEASRKPKGFIELLGRSNFSFLQGASHPEEMVEQAILNGYKGLGLCDLNGLYGVVRGYEAVNRPSHFVASPHAQKDFRYLIGSEILLTDSSSVVLMPMNKHGYSQLCLLLTLGKRQAQKGFSKLSLEDLLPISHDCLAFPLPPWNEKTLQRYIDHFGNRLFLPVWKDLSWESLGYYQDALRWEREKGVSLFVTQRPLMHDRSRKAVFDVVTCLLHQTTLEDAKSLLTPNAERVLRPLPELYHLWKERPDLVEKSLEIAERVDFSLSEIRYRYPRSALPERRTPSEQLKFLTEEGLRTKFPAGVPPQIAAQVEKELVLIKELQYEDYFLTLQEICEFAKEKKILYQGRGSAANSVVCYAIGLTAVDPTQIDLLFERFISKERNEPPDIDIDFEHERREEVIQHIYKKYGEYHAAMVCNVIRYRSRLAFRETAKVFGVPLKAINAAIKHMGRDGLRRLQAEPLDPAHLKVDPLLWRKVLELSVELQGFPRHLSIHSGGFIITQDPLNELVPVEKATMEGRFVVQWNKDDVNTLGLMKIDLLSLGMLTCLRKSLDLLRINKNISLELGTLPPDDPKTYDMICKAETIGVFQIESRAQMMTLPRMRPRKYYDLVIEVAIVRPGPLQGGMVHPFLRRRQGLEPVTYPDPDPELQRVLRNTMGVPIFQEQIMKIAVISAGFTPGEADELRRLMTSAWKRKGVMEGIRGKIMSGLAKKKIQPHYAEQIFKMIEGFASYGFPESHAASFALLTYASCYIKCHHPDAFLCALLNSQPMGFYEPRTLIADAQRNGVEVRDVDLNRSSVDSHLEVTGRPLQAVRLGLRRIHSFPEETAIALVREREERGPYKDFKDLIHRTNLPRVLLAKLASAGALKDFSSVPRELLWQIKGLELDQNHFLYGESRLTSKTEAAQLPAESPWREMLREYQQKGLSITLHPMSAVRSQLLQRNEELLKNSWVPYCLSTDLPMMKQKVKVRAAGLVGITQRPPTAKGFCFITLEDEHGCFNIIVPPQIYQRDRPVIYSSSLLEIHGTLEKTGTILNIRADRVLALGADVG